MPLKESSDPVLYHVVVTGFCEDIEAFDLSVIHFPGFRCQQEKCGAFPGYADNAEPRHSGDIHRIGHSFKAGDNGLAVH